MLHGLGDCGSTDQLYSPAGLIQLAASRHGCPAPPAHTGSAAFQHLCAAFEAARPGQTAFGKLHARAILLDALGKACRLAEYKRRFPEIGTQALPDPVFIVAPFRTGTTFLHRLLACDPDARWPRLWEVAYPPPADPHLRGDPRYLTEDARIAQAGAALRTLGRASPLLRRLHPMAPDLAEECFGFLETSFLSHSFMVYAELPSYLDWLDARDAADWRAAYATYADQLRLLQWWHPGGRWVLKSPFHLWNLDTLLDTFPRAHVIQLHRDPVDAMGSFCRLLAAYRQAMCKATDPVAIGRQACRATRGALHRAVQARRGSDAQRFIDVDFAELISDPLASAQAIYARIGARWSPEAEGAMRRWLSRTMPAAEPGSARIGSFGLDACRVRDMFAPYAACRGSASGN